MTYFWARLPRNRREAFWWWLRSWVSWRYLRVRWEWSYRLTCWWLNRQAPATEKDGGGYAEHLREAREVEDHQEAKHAARERG